MTTLLVEQTISERDFRTVQSLIYDLAGIALADSKQIMVQSRLCKRLRALGLDSYSDYIEYLQSPANDAEVTHFINALTTNKTDFFRENHHFDFLTREAFPAIARRAEQCGERRLRIWCSASSTGEEPYTIAMTVREFFGNDSRWDIRVLASDIDTNVLKKAAEGVYDADRAADLPPQLIKKYFARESRAADAPIHVKPTLRDLITFRRINLQDATWPIKTQFDVIFCRNVMIYFDTDSQRRIISHFGKYLKSEGHLIVGHSESLLGLTDRFQLHGETIYRHTGTGSSSAIPPASKSTTRIAVQKPQTRTRRETSVSSSGTRQLTVKHSLPTASSGSGPTALPGKQSIILGQVHVSREPLWITTLLGSCVAVCLYDETACIGGMNHFMLPRPRESSVTCTSYGVHSMELLINSIMKAGGNRRNLKAKFFGGSRVMQESSLRVGQQNVEFTKHFLETERIPIVASYTEQQTGMHVQFHTHTNKVLVRLLDSRLSRAVEREDLRKSATVEKSMDESDEAVLF